MTARIPAAPKGVGPLGKKLWREVLSEHELTQSELAVLTAACRCVTTCERIAAELERLAEVAEDDAVDPEVRAEARAASVTGSLVMEQRQQAATLTRLIASLRLPEEDESRRPQHRGAARGAYEPRALRVAR